MTHTTSTIPIPTWWLTSPLRLREQMTISSCPTITLKSTSAKVTVKANKKAVKKVAVKVKVFTGKKSKTYNIKTNNKGVAKLNTKKLKVGKHKVVISSGNSNYKISAKSKITIKK